MAFWDSLISIAPSVISAGASLIGNNAINNANKDAAAGIGQGYREADAIYQPAYDEVLGYDLGSLGAEGDIWDQQMGALSPFYSGMASDYATGARGAATRYADEMTGADARLRGDLMSGAAVYQDAIDPAYGQADEFLRSGYGAADEMLRGGYADASARFDPYSEAGAEALGALRGVIARQPDELTPGQMRQREQSIRDMRAGQAASGLRGSGRAGVAAFNEGVGNLDANFYDINQRRIDDAMRTLNSTGYSASGAQAGLSADEAARRGALSTDEAARRGALSTDRGAKVGSAWRDAVNKAGDASYDTGKSIGDAWMRTDDAVLQSDMRYGEKVGGMADSYYTDARRRAAAEADARASATMGKANSGAAAVAGPSFANARAGLASGATRADTYGALGSFIASGINQLKPKTP